MIYGQFRTLINLLLVLALGATFLWGSFRVFGAFSSASPPPATPTPRPVIEQPTIVPTAVPTKRAQKTGPPAAPTKTPTPRPSPTPQGPAKVIAALSESDDKGAKSFSVASVPLVGGEPELWCRVRNSALPAVGAITFFWYKDPNPNAFVQYTASRLNGEFTDGYLKDTDFQTPGSKFHCSVAVNGQQIGSAHFAITP